MRLRLLSIALIVLALASLAAVPASARHRDRDRGRRFDRRSRVIVVPQYRGYYRPYGWDRGHKRGWRGGHLPPGLAKKYGYRSNFRHDHRRVNRLPVIIIPFSFR
jgi:hypothetical protein